MIVQFYTTDYGRMQKTYQILWNNVEWLTMQNFLLPWPMTNSYHETHRNCAILSHSKLRQFKEAKHCHIKPHLLCTLQLYRKLILLESIYGSNHSYFIFLQFFWLRRYLLTKQQSRILFVVWKKGSKINIACMRRALMQTLGWNHFWRKIPISIHLNFHELLQSIRFTIVLSGSK